MKPKRFIYIFILFISIITNAQVTTFGDNKPEDFKFLPHEGSRIIQGFRVDMGNNKYCIVYSKPEKGITRDTIYIQEYIKNNDNWIQNIKAYRSSPNTLFIWGKRGGFTTDDEKNGLAYTGFSEEDLATNKRYIVGYFILYKNQFFTIEENTEGIIKKSENYNLIPARLQNHINTAFSELNKWN